MKFIEWLFSEDALWFWILFLIIICALAIGETGGI